MSLFRNREWWTAQAGDGEEFDRGSLAIGPVDGNAQGEDRIVVGSLSGRLRIYQPSSKGSTVNDLLLEKDVGIPILQLAVGKFQSKNQAKQCLAVLHPQKLSVLDFAEVTTSASGQQTTQTLNGLLCFFEQERPSFTCSLPTFLIPGPLQYIQTLDSLVTCNSLFEIQSFKYRILATNTIVNEAQASIARPQINTDETKKESIKRAESSKADWTIVPARFSSPLGNEHENIVVLGERTLFVLHASGSIMWQRRLDVDGFALARVPAGDQRDAPASALRDNVAVFCTGGEMLVLSHDKHLWSSILPAPAVSAAIGTIESTRGLVVSLAESGRLDVSYLGTDPPVSKHAPVTTEPDYESLDRELAQHMQYIKEAGKHGRSEPSDRVLLRTQMGQCVPLQGHARRSAIAAQTIVRRIDAPASAPQQSKDFIFPGRTVEMRVYASYTGGSAIENARLTVSTPPGIQCDTDAVVIPSLGGARATPQVILLTFTALASNTFPASRTVHLAVHYTGQVSPNQTAAVAVELPLALVAVAVPPIRETSSRVTVTFSTDPVPLPRLFADMWDQSSQNEDNVLSLRYIDGSDATILLSRNGSRYRIQGCALRGLTPLLLDLEERIRNYANDKDGTGAGVQIACDEQLPVHELYAAIDAHFEARKAVRNAAQELARLSAQMRAAQRRLLARLKDKNPQDTGPLSHLLRLTFTRIHEVVQSMKNAQYVWLARAQELSASILGVVTILRYRYEIPLREIDELFSYLSPDVLTLDDAPTSSPPDTLTIGTLSAKDEDAGVEDSTVAPVELGWEEKTDAALLFLLRSALARNDRERSAATVTPNVLSSTAKLKKHVGLVLDRMAKGMRILQSDS